jgi:hypothetical protein
MLLAAVFSLYLRHLENLLVLFSQRGFGRIRNTRLAFWNIIGASTPTLFVMTADMADLCRILRKAMAVGDKNCLYEVKVVEQPVASSGIQTEFSSVSVVQSSWERHQQ